MNARLALLALATFSFGSLTATELPSVQQIQESLRVADGLTVELVASEPLAPASADLEWAHEEPQLESIAERASQQVARALDRLRQFQPRGRPVGTAA